MNTVLAIDTASTRFALALAREGEVVAAMEHEGEQEHSEHLLASIDQLLEGQRDKLRGIVVVRGPGSYAGLRVGMATAEGLALALGVPVAGVDTLEAVAAAADKRGGEVLAIHPAGRGEFAVQPFRSLQPAAEIAVVQASGVTGENVAGEGAAELGGKEVAPEDRARAALEVGMPRLQQAPGAVEALYVRAPNITAPRDGRRG